MSKNILVSTLGLSWEIIPETLSAFLFDESDPSKDFCANLKRVSGKKDTPWFTQGHYRECIGTGSIDELWLISTDQKRDEKNPKSMSLMESLKEIEQWKVGYEPARKVVIRAWVLDGVSDIYDEGDVEKFRDMTMRVMAFAHRYGCNPEESNRVIVSLACGRKTMSADIQDAAYCFGCDASVHIILDENGNVIPVRLKPFPKSDLMDKLLEEASEESLFGSVQEQPLSGDCPEVKIRRFVSDGNFLRKIDEQRNAAAYFYSSFWSKQEYSYDTFPVLYTLSQKTQADLRNFRIGVDRTRQEEELQLLQGLPKADLHCHLGGCLSVSEMVQVACTLKKKIAEQETAHPLFARWNAEPPKTGESWKEWRNRVAGETGVSSIYVVPKFLCSYENRIEDLDQLIYGSYREERNFVSIAPRAQSEEGEALDLSPYERLGDLQGTGLLCHPETLEQCVRILMEHARENQVEYQEIRCSPINYASEGYFEKQDVVWTILKVLEEFQDVKSSILFIASRHSDEKRIKEGVALYETLRELPGEQGKLFLKYFRGFDLAGNEASKKAEEMMNHFKPVKESCLNITIHAGETMAVDSIWQAVYCLNAERIGHGLTLKDNDSLMEKFRDRRIGVEMCPSSNFQTVGFRDNYFPELEQAYGRPLREYPLQRYLNFGLRVCVNTDDPGISRTCMTRELLKAARLTQDGLSLWEIFALLYNSFDLAFLSYNEKRELLNRANEKMKQWISCNVRKIENNVRKIEKRVKGAL